MLHPQTRGLRGYYYTAQLAVVGVANNKFLAQNQGYFAEGAGALEFNPFTQHFVPEKPDDINEGLREAIKAGDVPQCLSLISSNADPNYRDRQGNTPLHMAALFQRTEVAKALLVAGSDLTLKNGAGELPDRMASVSLKMKFNTFKETGAFEKVAPEAAAEPPAPVSVS